MRWVGWILRSVDAVRSGAARAELASNLAPMASDLHQLQPQLPPHDFSGALQALDRGAAVVRVEQAIDLGAACFHQLGHPLFCDFLFLHFTRKLACDHGLDRGCGHLLADSGVVEPAFEAGTYMRVFPYHDCNFLNLSLASVNSSGGLEAFRHLLYQKRCTNATWNSPRSRASARFLVFGLPPGDLPPKIASLYRVFPDFPSCDEASPIMTTTIDTAPISQPFQAEVAELLHLMVHSVYSETDIFLRELISNASDACDKLRYEAIAAPDLIADGEAPKILIAPDKKADTLSVIDSGIGMDRQELIDNLGTIARSGTRSFLSRLTEAKDGAGLIGQFGVGLYSAFMGADRIVVTSRRAGADQVWSWSSSGGSGFEISPASEDDAKRIMSGTAIVLHLKPDAKKYLESYEIERVVGAYSDNIQFPILLKSEDGEPSQINSASALWQRPKSELT